MESLEIVIPDNEGNHLVVALDFYDERYEISTLHIPAEYSDIEIADISISKLDLDTPISIRAFDELSRWLIRQFDLHDNAVFTFICSIDPLETNHSILPEEYRWRLFDKLYRRACVNYGLRVNVQDVVIGPDGFRSGARAFYRDRQSPIIHLVVDHLKEKQT